MLLKIHSNPFTSHSLNFFRSKLNFKDNSNYCQLLFTRFYSHTTWLFRSVCFDRNLVECIDWIYSFIVFPDENHSIVYIPVDLNLPEKYMHQYISSICWVSFVWNAWNQKYPFCFVCFFPQIFGMKPESESLNMNFICFTNTLHIQPEDNSISMFSVLFDCNLSHEDRCRTCYLSPPVIAQKVLNFQFQNFGLGMNA